jgi:hypothetical protein
MGQAHPANRTIWDRLTLQTEPNGTGSPCKQTNRTIWDRGRFTLKQTNRTNRTIWDMLTLQKEPNETGSQCKQNHMGQAHPANRTIWDKLTLQTEPYGTGAPCKQTNRTIWDRGRLTLKQTNRTNRTIWDRLILQTEPYGTGSPFKTETYKTGSFCKQTLLRQVHPSSITIGIVSLCKDYDMGKSHSANKTTWDGLTLKTKLFGTAHPEKQNLFRYTLLTQKTGPLEKDSA